LHTRLRALAALLLSAAAGWAAAQQPPAEARLPMVGGGLGGTPQGSCAPQVWPREALRYEIEGTTQLAYRLSPEGRATDATVARSSGWALLDDASLKALQTCTFTPRDVAGAQGRLFPIQFVWMLDGARVMPSLVPGSCVADGVIDGFQPYDRRPTDAGGVKVRFLVDGNGVPRGVKLEGDPAPALADQVRRHLDTCRFRFDPASAGMRTDTMNGRVLLR